MASGSITSIENLPVVKRLLLSMKISQETADLLGVAPDQLEAWLHSLAGLLDTLPAVQSQKLSAASSGYPLLSAEEMHFLLDGYAAPSRGQDSRSGAFSLTK